MGSVVRIWDAQDLAGAVPQVDNLISIALAQHIDMKCILQRNTSNRSWMDSAQDGDTENVGSINSSFR